MKTWTGWESETFKYRPGDCIYKPVAVVSSY